MDFLSGSKRKRVHEVDLIPMIAIFSMLILFLIAGTVLSNANIEIPTHLSLAKSDKKANLSVSPSIVISDHEVTFSIADIKIPRDSLSPQFRQAQSRRQLRQNLKTYFSSRKVPSKDIPFQLVADRGLPYRDLFQIVNELRNDGIDSFLFISEVKN